MFTLENLVQRFGGEIHGDAQTVIRAPGTLQDGKPGEIGFLAESAYGKYLPGTRLSALIVNAAQDNAPPHLAQWVVGDVKKTWRQICDAFAPPVPPAVISPHAFIADGARIGADVAIGAGSVVEDGAVIGSGTRLAANVTVEAGVILGENCRIAAGVCILRGSRLGNRVCIESNAVIGSRGFGLNFEDGRWLPIAQLGGVEIGDDVEIGACTTVDCGAVRPTVLEEGVKLDNHIQVGHNVRIGAHSLFAGSTVIAGSTTFGKYCVVGGASVFAGHITICDGTQFTGHSSISKSITAPGVYSSAMPVMPSRDWKRFLAKLKLLGKEK